jgi:hypothetical protein
MQDEVKGTVFREIGWGLINWPMLILFLVILTLKSALCVYEEYAKQKSLKNLPISTNF